MRSEPIYLDHAATTPIDPTVRAAMEPYLSGIYGNPSSLHAFGREARRALDRARDSMARSLECQPGEIYFTSGGTEADNLALFGLVRARRPVGCHVLVSAVEHLAVLSAADRLASEGFEVERLPVGPTGRVDIESVRASLRVDTALVSVMWANNEVGAVQPVEEIARVCAERGIPFHTDAVQAAGTIDTALKWSGLTALSISSHKLYGPKGCGALVVRSGNRFEPILYGGGQERERRSGTENVAGIVGMARALELCASQRTIEAVRERALTELFREQISESVDDLVWNGPSDDRLSGLLNVSFLGTDAATLLVQLDLAGIAASSGSACSSGAIEPSHVLAAMGCTDPVRRSAVRFSIGRTTASCELDDAAERVARTVARCRRARRSGGKERER